MPYVLEKWGNKAIVTNAKTGRHYSLMPLPIERAKAQLRVLQQAEKKESPK